MKNSNQRLMRWSWKLQEWSPYIQHIKGRDNVVADFFSRHSSPDNTQIEREGDYMYPPIRVCKLSLTCNLDRDVIRAHQEQCPGEMAEIYAGPEFSTINGVVYKIVGNKTLPVIPTTLLPKFLAEFHDSPHSGHLGVEKTKRKISSRAFFTHMHKRISEYIRSCDICQRVKISNQKPPGLLQSSPTEAPWETLYTDLMGPYVKSHPGGYTHILVVIDGFSKWTEIFPLRNATAVAVGKVLEEQVFCHFGMPKTLVSDNGTSFTANIISYLCKQWQVQLKFTSPYHPQSNLTERENRTIKTMIRAYLDGQPHKNWPKYLPFFRFAINSSVQDSTGFSPAKILLNKELSVPFDISTQFSEAELTLLKSSIENPQRDIIFDRAQEYSKLLSLVTDNLNRAKAKQKHDYDQRRRHDEFRVGDSVVIQSTIRSDKDKGVAAGLAPLYRPDIAQIHEVLSNLNYKIIFEDGTIYGPIHIQRLRRYIHRDADPSAPPQLSPATEPSPPCEVVVSPHNFDNNVDINLRTDSNIGINLTPGASDTISPLPSTTTTYNGMPSLVDESAAQPPIRRSTRSTRRPARYGPLRPNSQQDPPSSQHRQMPLLTPYTARD
ncbi:Transposon Tf2-6 polyprotein [Folsomia candida]|uniref:RNA-directed DNA polymerase n=1 Tax=Folsomia candida TaxID=158441 RepID=A0A226DG32_FOLCA|nr:Transposon Tf2-6 polyprotein [Folsomia candida]